MLGVNKLDPDYRAKVALHNPVQGLNTLLRIVILLTKYSSLQ